MDDEKIKGEYAWAVMALGILTYDLIAIKTKKMETMSHAVWKSLSHPVKFPIAATAWGVLTHHLFVNHKARNSIRQLRDNIVNNKGVTK
jgi:hypothetical protein